MDEPDGTEDNTSILLENKPKLLGKLHNNFL